VTPKVGAGLVLALGSASALNWGFFAQHRAASALPPLSVRRPVRSLRLLFSNLRWLAGFLIGILGWVLYVAALALAPLSLVQAVSAGGIGLLALLVTRLGHVPLEARERLGVGIALIALVLLGLSLGGHAVAERPGAWKAVALWIGASAVSAALLGGPVSRALVGGAGLGMASGILYAAGDVATKAATAGGARLWFVPVLLACHGFGFVALQMGFQRGEALATAGVSTLLTNALPILAGLALFDDDVPGGAFGVLRVAAFVGVVTGAALLARAGERPSARSRLKASGCPYDGPGRGRRDASRAVGLRQRGGRGGPDAARTRTGDRPASGDAHRGGSSRRPGPVTPP
jgi:hypothetical protein